MGEYTLTKLHELCPKVGGRQKGARIKGILDAHGERVVEGSMVFTRKAKAEELPAVKFYLMRHMPSIDDPTKPAVHEISAGKVANAKIGEVWAGEGDLKFFPVALRRGCRPEPREGYRSFLFQYGHDDYRRRGVAFLCERIGCQAIGNRKGKLIALSS